MKREQETSQANRTRQTCTEAHLALLSQTEATQKESDTSKTSTGLWQLKQRHPKKLSDKDETFTMELSDSTSKPRNDLSDHWEASSTEEKEHFWIRRSQQENETQ